MQLLSTLNNTNLTLCDFELCNILWGHLITYLKGLLHMNIHRMNFLLCSYVLKGKRMVSRLIPYKYMFLDVELVRNDMLIEHKLLGLILNSYILPTAY